MANSTTKEDKAQSSPQDAPVTEQKKDMSMNELASLLQTIIEGQGTISGRLDNVIGRVNKIEGAKEESETRTAKVNMGVPEDVLATVEDILGPEFEVRVANIKGLPAYELTVVVPEKYSELKSTATKAEIERKKEIEATIGGIESERKRSEMWEELFAINGKIAPEDRRCVVVPYSEGVNKVREYCLKIKATVAKHINKGIER